MKQFKYSISITYGSGFKRCLCMPVATCLINQLFKNNEG
jgi:hypothetical protein